jgi:membrane fusion protein, multidrug efflux system
MVGRVDRLGGELGSGFGSGAIMASIDCSEHHARLKMSEAEYHAAKEQHEAKLRLQGLQAAGEVEVQLAASAAQKSRAQIDLTKAQMRLCQVNAPFAGRVVKLHVKQYQGVNIGQPIMDIVSAGPLKLRMNAPSKWLSWLKIGIAFQIQIDETGKTYPATVSAINGRVDAVSQSVEVEGSVRGAYAELLAGMSGQARFSQVAP